MTKRFVILVFAATTLLSVLVATAPSASAQTKPDLTGLWKAFPQGGTGSNGDLTSRLEKGSELILTPYGAERYKNVDTGKGDPGAKCLPGGPLRGLWGLGHPFFIVQHRDVISLNFESQGGPRLIYTDGRPQPEDVYELPGFFGHTVGKWEGDTLVTDTVAVDERIWLDPSGHEHSDKLRITERYRMTGPNRIDWSATIDDPVFFVKPFTVTRWFERQTTKGDRFLSHSCVDNELDLEYMRSEYGGIGKPKIMGKDGKVTQYVPPNPE
jgi:hypothetical protein